MKNSIFVFSAAVTISAALGIRAASGADLLPARTYAKTPAVVAVSYDWSGFYAGVNAGGMWTDNNTSINTFSSSTTFGLAPAQALGLIPANTSLSRRGSFLGGGQVGYNWQAANYVLGIEADIDGIANNKSSFSSVSQALIIGNVAFNPVTTQVSRSSSYIGTVRGRAGLLLTPSFLAYVTGGLAYGDTSATSSISTGPSIAATSFSQTRAGWTAGGGFEWMFMPAWSLKAEALYYDLGRATSPVGLLAPAALTTGYTISTRTDGAIGRVGLNYHFGGPVVAKY